MSAVAKIGYVEAQRDASAAAHEALVGQFEKAGFEAQEAQEIVARYVERASTKFMTENENLFAAEGLEYAR